MTASLGYTSIEGGGAHPETRRSESLEPSHITNISLRTRFPARPPVHPRQGGLMMGRAEPCRAGDPASMPLSTSTVVFLGAGLPRDKQLTCPAKACFAIVIAGGFQVFPGAGPAPSAFVKEDLRVFTPPSCATRPIFPDQDAKPHAGATVAVFAASAQFQHALLQFIACDDTRRLVQPRQEPEVEPHNIPARPRPTPRRGAADSNHSDNNGVAARPRLALRSF